MENYKVRLYMDNSYEVYSETVLDDGYDVITETHFIGSISDCEAWIRLRETGKI